MSDAPKLSRDAIERLAGRLRDDAERLARALLPGGTSRAGLYRAAPRSAGGPGDSLTVYLRGPRQGKWRHFGGDLDGTAHGDMLDLIMATQRLDKDEAHQWALRWLGLAPGAVEFRRTPAEEALARKNAAERYRAEMEKVARARKNAKALWLACKPLSLDNPAGQYLAGRIPGFGRLLELGWGMSALRYHPALKHPYDDSERGWPAMLALCQFGDGKIATVHRYYLTRHGEGWDVLREKRDGLDGKLAWCAIEGGFCAVWRGSRTDADSGEVREGWPWRRSALRPRGRGVRGRRGCAEPGRGAARPALRRGAERAEFHADQAARVGALRRVVRRRRWRQHPGRPAGRPRARAAGRAGPRRRRRAPAQGVQGRECRAPRHCAGGRKRSRQRPRARTAVRGKR
jgi:hypothetical protein